MGDLGGRCNLSERALQAFVLWFLKVCLDQVEFMSGLFDLNTVSTRLRRWVEGQADLDHVAASLLEEALVRGEIPRGATERSTGMPERSARRLLSKLTGMGMKNFR